MVWVALLAVAGCTSEEHVVGRGTPTSTKAAGTCPEFEPATNMLTTSWTDDPANEASAATLVQIVGDSAAASDQVLTELFAACSLIAAVGDEGLASPSIPPTIAEVRDACAAATSAVDSLRLARPAIATIQAIPRRCEEQRAVADCLATCTDGETCQAYCESATPWLSQCPAAAVTISFDQEVDEGLLLLWDEVAEGLSLVFAARSRLAVAKRSLARLAFVPSDAYTLDTVCIRRLIGTITETTEGTKLSGDVVSETFEAIQVEE